jgi:uncharacterized protein (DUF1501 family)
MLTFFNGKSGGGRFCDGVSRRSFLKLGALGFGGLALSDLMRLRAIGAVNLKRRPKSVIMICLGGGPSQLDTYDMKPDAPAEFRGEFNPIRSNVPGMQMCELLPKQARIADKFSVLRSATWTEPDHQRIEIFTGFGKKAPRRPSFGSLVSRMYAGGARDESLPRFVSLSSEYNQELSEAEEPVYAGGKHRAFIPRSAGLASLSLDKKMDLSRVNNRRDLLAGLDHIRRDVDAAGAMGAMDAYQAQAYDLITSGRARKAFDVTDEPAAAVERYKAAGAEFKYLGNKAQWDWQAFLRARRLVEAGVPFVSLQVGLWDHHCNGAGNGTIFEGYRTLLPCYDASMAALITDLHERGLSEDVCVVAWGEFGRTPRVNPTGGRDHWPGAGCVLFAGGGLRMGQYAGATDARAAAPVTRPYGPQNILATLYHVLGIDPSATIPDNGGRPTYLLDDRDVVAELV